MVSGRGFAAVALHNPQDGANVGGALRACRCYGAAFLAVSGNFRGVNHPAAVKGHRHFPVLFTESVLDCAPFQSEVVAVEIVEGAKNLRDFKHPERALYVFGPEGGSLDEELLRSCDHVVAVDTKLCMNLAATVNVVLYDRHSKELDVGGSGDGDKDK